MSNPKSVIETARKQGAKMVDMKFVDTFGTWQHFTVPMAELTEASFAEGQGGLLSGGAQRHAAGHPHRDVRSF
jgi:glutamine synthetase